MYVKKYIKEVFLSLVRILVCLRLLVCGDLFNDWYYPSFEQLPGWYKAQTD